MGELEKLRFAAGLARDGRRSAVNPPATVPRDTAAPRVLRARPLRPCAKMRKSSLFPNFAPCAISSPARPLARSPARPLARSHSSAPTRATLEEWFPGGGSCERKGQYSPARCQQKCFGVRREASAPRRFRRVLRVWSRIRPPADNPQSGVALTLATALQSLRRKPPAENFPRLISAD